MEVEDVIVWLQTLTHIVCCIEGRREPAHAGHDSLGEPVGNPLFTRNVEAGQQFTARLQGSQNLRVCLVLLGEYMEAVHAEHGIEYAIFERQCSNVALHGMYVGDTCSTESVLSLLQHVLAIVQTGDVGSCKPNAIKFT